MASADGGKVPSLALFHSAATGSGDGRNVGTPTALFSAVFVFLCLSSLNQLHKGGYKFRGKESGMTQQYCLVVAQAAID